MYNKIIAGIKKVLDLIKPFIIGMIIAYLLFGPMNAIENFLMKKNFL